MLESRALLAPPISSEQRQDLGYMERGMTLRSPSRELCLEMRNGNEWEHQHEHWRNTDLATQE
jgi:hypothetical protein